MGMREMRGGGGRRCLISCWILCPAAGGLRTLLLQQLQLVQKQITEGKEE